MASIKLKGDTSGEITISSPSVAGTNTLELQATSGTLATTAQASIGMKNLIINGNMQIAQRATNVTGITTTGYRTVDRFSQVVSSAGTWTQTQSADAPTGAGFYNSWEINCTTANASLAAGAFLIANHSIEGFNLQQLGYGAAGAKTITLSFWIKSNKTGTYILGIYRPTSGRQISTSYSISVANTWEKKTITIGGDTTGAITNANTEGFRISWWLGAGSNFSSGTLQTSWGSLTSANRAVGQVNLADSTANSVNITGVQLEVGTVATPFENLQYGQQLQLCQRYYERVVSSLAQAALGDTYANTAGSPVPTINLAFKQTKRALPTMALVGTFTSSNTQGVQQLFGGENTFSAYFLANAVGRSYFFPLANSGWSADSEL